MFWPKYGFGSKNHGTTPGICIKVKKCWYRNNTVLQCSVFISECSGKIKSVKWNGDVLNRLDCNKMFTKAI